MSFTIAMLRPTLSLMVVSGLAGAGLATAVQAEMAAPTHGLIEVESDFSVEETADRLEASLEERGLTVFNRIDHAENATTVDQELRPTELVIFGNPMAGTALMQCNQTVGIDLPLKALIWEDEAGEVWFAYNAPAYLMERHQLQDCEAVIENISNALAGLATAATEEM